MKNIFILFVTIYQGTLTVMNFKYSLLWHRKLN